MGFFDFLKPKQMQVETVMTAPVKNFPSMPTVKPDQEIYACYDEIFLNEIASVTGVTAQEKTEILKIVKTVGFMDLSAYQERVWNTYFKGRSWAWGEFEERNSTFQQLGKFPSRFPQRTNFSPDNLYEVLNKLKVAELKTLCEEHQIPTGGKTKKQELIQFLQTITTLYELPLIQEQVKAAQEKFALEIYSLLMRTLNFRATNLYNLRRAEKIGVENFEVCHVFECDREFVELALQKNPNALHPVYPSDMSVKKPVIDF